jgi:hypothetical protein
LRSVEEILEEIAALDEELKKLEDGLELWWNLNVIKLIRIVGLSG